MRVRTKGGELTQPSANPPLIGKYRQSPPSICITILPVSSSKRTIQRIIIQPSCDNTSKNDTPSDQFLLEMIPGKGLEIDMEFTGQRFVSPKCN